MIRRLYAAALTAFAVVAVFFVLAVTQRPPAQTSQAAPAVLVRSATGALVPATVAPGGAHATTQTSQVASGTTTLVQGANGSLVPTAVQTHVTTRTS
jgi:hypothetical protein